MFDKAQITRSMIQSPLDNGLQYIQANMEYHENFSKYKPNPQALVQIRNWLDKLHEELHIVAFGASWCKDCKLQLPSLVKIMDTLQDPRFTVEITGTIKAQAPYERIPGKPIWKVPPSPPETQDPKFDMGHIPAIYLFNKKGACLGKIDEKPEHKATLEEELVYYLLV